MDSSLVRVRLRQLPTDNYVAWLVVGSFIFTKTSFISNFPCSSTNEPLSSFIEAGADSPAGDPGERFSLILTNPPFGKKSSIAIVNEEGDLEKESTGYER